ncbi:MAG: hypothetical protein KY468_06815 [Armatimonadetes bacterium]|nr:hypothetical protein [Armatimonadota bacterium]
MTTSDHPESSSPRPLPESAGSPHESGPSPSGSRGTDEESHAAPRSRRPAVLFNNEEQYRNTVVEVAATDGIVMLIGATDTGKTTFCKAVAEATLAMGRRIAIVDADTGQSEIGPPTTLGLGIPETAFHRLSDLRPRALAFIGSTSPAGYLLEWASGTRFLTDRARALAADLILVDMPGLVSGPIGLRLNQGVAEALQPSAYVLLERKHELRAIGRGLPPGRMLRPGIPPQVHAKTGTVRSLRRATRYAQYFQDAREWELPVDRGILRGGMLFLGRPLRPSVLEALQESLSVRLLHIEKDEDGVRVVTAGAPSKEERAILTQRFGRRTMLLEASRLRHLVVGLLDRDGATVGIGSVHRVDYRRRRLRLVTPWIDPEAIGGFIWGTARVTPEGKELEALKRGEI